MSRVRTEGVYSKSVGRRVGETTNGWRCLQCTFHNTGDVCTMCQQPRPKVPKSIKQQKPGKPYIQEKKPKQEEKKSETYYDPTDGSFNVPIAGIKKYDHKPGKNIITLNSLKEHAKEEHKEGNNIVTLDSLKKKSVEKKIGDKRDLLGLLQDAASDEPLPCMRKNKEIMQKK